MAISGFFQVIKGDSLLAALLFLFFIIMLPPHMGSRKKGGVLAVGLDAFLKELWKYGPFILIVEGSGLSR